MSFKISLVLIKLDALLRLGVIAEHKNMHADLIIILEVVRFCKIIYNIVTYKPASD